MENHVASPGDNDEYGIIGEFHDLFMIRAWQNLRPLLTRAFGALGQHARLVDVGAGSGVGTRLLAGVTPGRITAVEPSRLMRAVLLSRLLDDDRLARRVTVLAGRAPSSLEGVPTPIDGFLCAHMLGHLNATDRQATLRWLAGALSAGGAGVITVSPERSLDSAVEQSLQLGEQTLVARYLPCESEERQVSEYEVRDGDCVVRFERVVGVWRPLTRAQLEVELATAGLAVEATDSDAVLVRRTA